MVDLQEVVSEKLHWKCDYYICDYFSSDLDNINKDSLEFKNIVWRKRFMQLHVNEVAFRGKTDLPSEVKKLKTPIDFFTYFFTDELFELIYMETNRAAITENVNTSFKVDKYEIRRYIGVLTFMSIFRYPNTESYWSEYGFKNIPNCMSKNKFEQIRKYLSFNDESQRVKKGCAGYDPLFRIRKVAGYLVERFDSIPKNARLCVDEQMCSTKMAHHLRQYLPDKPHPWGVKFFVLCDTNGYAYRFEIYSGSSNHDIILPGTPDIGATGNVVIRLSQTVPNFVNHILYFDNFYTSLPLLVYLRARGIYSLGTVRANRIPKCKLPTDKSEELKKAPRGYSTEFVATAYGADISNVSLLFNKIQSLENLLRETQAQVHNNNQRSSTYQLVEPAHSSTHNIVTNLLANPLICNLLLSSNH
ncbi:piggyBac transposable element-derived protein 1-like [Eurosta solidaginis]|uniref:piggyBac transposable element-derived protein 1-like n=1 Tax=Eurosta solidaginis TaxID=178769 RepID=UPI003530DBA5